MTAEAGVAKLGNPPGLENAMETCVDEIADGIYRLSTFFPEVVPPAGFTINQFLVLADEPLLFHCGLRAMFPSSLAAVASSCRSSGCAGSPLATLRRTSAAR